MSDLTIELADDRLLVAAECPLCGKGDLQIYSDLGLGFFPRHCVSAGRWYVLCPMSRQPMGDSVAKVMDFVLHEEEQAFRKGLSEEELVLIESAAKELRGG